jgi:phage terminase large subunit-like protein
MRQPAEDLNRSLGPQLIDWAEHFLVHGPGDLQGEPLKFDNDFYRFVARMYALDTAGRRLYTEAFLSRAKGCAKSELAGCACCWEFIGPCRFDHWAVAGEVSYWGYEYAEGEPVGRPVVDPFIRILATEEDQTGNTYDNVAYMLEHLCKGPGAFHFPKIDYGRSWQSSTRVFLQGGGEIRPSTAGAASKDGGKETFCVADETHLYVTTELRKMFEVVTRNMGSKRKLSEPHMLQTSTMYAPGEDSIAERTHVAHESGTLKGVLFDHVQGPEVKNMRHTNVLREALRIAYRDRPWIDYERLIALAQDPRTAVSDVLRYCLNRPTVPENAWIDPDSVKAATVTETEPGDSIPPAGSTIAMGFDGSISEDWTALTGCELHTGRVFVIDYWDPDASGEIDQDDVDAAVDWAFKEYDVVLFYGDPARWGSWLAGWARRYGTKIVREFWTHRETEMARATLELHTAIITRQVSLADQPMMRRHFLNARKRRHPAGILIKKDRPNSPRKIDIAVSAILAYAARNKALAAGLGKRRSGKVVVYT